MVPDMTGITTYATRGKQDPRAVASGLGPPWVLLRLGRCQVTVLTLALDAQTTGFMV